MFISADLNFVTTFFASTVSLIIILDPPVLRFFIWWLIWWTPGASKLDRTVNIFAKTPSLLWNIWTHI